MRIGIAIAPLHREPNARSVLDTELLFGEIVEILETYSSSSRDLIAGSRASSLDPVVKPRSDGENWMRVCSQTDGYIGWLSEIALAENEEEPTHIISALGSFVYSDADLKSPALMRLSFLSRVCVREEKGDYARTAQGWLHRATLHPIGELFHNPLAVARLFLNVPYKWGGRSSLGIDCSALVQLAHAACGIALPRDSGPQSQFLSDKPRNAPETGDIFYVPSHIGFISGPDTVLHASGETMRVVEEPLDDMLAQRGFTRADLRVKILP